MEVAVHQQVLTPIRTFHEMNDAEWCLHNVVFFQVERSRKERSAHHDEKEKSIHWSTNKHCESH